MKDTHKDNGATKILIVDDSPTDRAIFRRFLAQSAEGNYVFEEAEHISEAILKIERDLPHCILLDYDLPDAKGTDFIKKINERHGRNSIPIVMLSGSGSIEVVVDAINSGAQDYLVKSRATPGDLIRAVKNAIEKARLFREKEIAAEKIQISEERYRLLFENTPLPAIVFDRETLVVLAANDYAILHYGYTRDEFLLMTLNELDAFEGASEKIVIGEFCAKSDLIRSVPARHRKKDGTIIDVEVNCHDITFKGRDARFVIVQDITDRKKAEKKLKESEEFNRTVIESSPDCVKLLDKNGKLQFMNENGLCLMEIDDFSQFKNCDWHELWTDECREIVLKTLEMVRRGETGRFEGACPTAKGTAKWWDVIVTPVRNGNGEIEKILSVSRDITESKLIEQERENNLIREKELREEAESANRAKDEFLAVLSHELRTPLNAMSGWAKMLNQGILDEDKKQKALEVIERNIRLQNTLIEDLLDVSRIISGKIKLEPSEVNFCKIVADALETARFAAEAKHIEIESKTKTEECYGTGDAFRLQQIINNLLTNAIKFTPDGGKIFVNLETTPATAKITITDTGIGIEPELLPQIFERFKQADGSTKRKFGGLGLGLAIAKSLVEMHDGNITVTSEGKDKGATFTVELPVLQKVESETEKNVHISADGHSKNGKPLENLKILLVDDEPDSLELVRFVLANNGAKVFPFGNADEALENIEKIKPDLLISDISMADTDGYDLVRKIRELPSAKNKFLPAIAMTAYTSIEDRAAVLSAGFQMHIAKPIDINNVAAQISELLNTIQH